MKKGNNSPNPKIPMILMPAGYAMMFNFPELRSLAVPVRRKFLSVHRIWGPLQGVALYPPWIDHALLHTMNQIPLASKRWVVTFESHLPRTLTSSSNWLFRFLRRRLLDTNCRGLLAMSEWAKQTFLEENSEWDGLVALNSKLRVLHPSVKIRTRVPKHLKRGESLKLLFVGNNFARKGGIVALRLATKALKEKLPIEIHICSSMRFGKGCHTDFPDTSIYNKDMQSLKLPNVFFHGACNQDQVLSLFGHCQMSLLATLHDTYGFSIIEGFACGLPAITTNVCAQTEINCDGSGIVLHLPTSNNKRWTGLNKSHDRSYWDLLDSTYEDLANQVLGGVSQILSKPEQIESMSVSALHNVATRHDPETAASILSAVYGDCCL